VTGVPTDFQVTVDAGAPHDLAAWWADTLGWEVEPTDESFVRKMIAGGHATEDETMVHHGALVWKAGAAIVHPGGPASGRPRVLFQLVPEAKTVKNRVHLDLRPGPDGTEAIVARLAARGATELHRGAQGPHHWVTMADPEGNEFCVG
jgi:glyoxalase superfamily protein